MIPRIVASVTVVASAPSADSEGVHVELLRVVHNATQQRTAWQVRWSERGKELRVLRFGVEELPARFEFEYATMTGVWGP